MRTFSSHATFDIFWMLSHLVIFSFLVVYEHGLEHLSDHSFTEGESLLNLKDLPFLLGIPYLNYIR